MSQETLFQKEQDEKERIENLCEECKKNPQMWDINIRDKCEYCNRKYFIFEFRKIDLNEKGFRIFGDSFVFYSHTTGKETTTKKNVWRVFYGFMGTPTFPYCISLVDDENVFEHTFGITKELGEYLIKDLKLEKEKRGDDDEEEEWVNKNLQLMERVPKTKETPKEDYAIVPIEEAEAYRNKVFGTSPKKKKLKNQKKLM